MFDYFTVWITKSIKERINPFVTILRKLKKKKVLTNYCFHLILKKKIKY